MKKYKVLLKQNKNKKKDNCRFSVNYVNSSLGIQCIALGNCRSRHTCKCNNCKNNISKYVEKDYYEPK